MKIRIVLVLMMIFSVTALFAGFQFMNVEGLKVTVAGIQFNQGYQDATNVGYISLNQEVDLTGDPNDVLSSGFELGTGMGQTALTFDTISVELVDGVKIKAYTELAAGVFKYTTASGIGTYNNSVWIAPADYDYLYVSYFYDPVSEDGAAGRTQETTFLPAAVTIQPGDSLTVSLLVDTYKVAYFWDGNDSTRHGFVETIPFSSPTAFPSGTPVISLTYLPLYVFVNRSVSSETYVVTLNSNSTAVTGVTDDNYDEKQVMFMTLVFDQTDGSFLTGRTSNWDGLDISFSMAQFVRDGVLNGDQYTLSLSSFSDTAGWVVVDSITGFSRQQVGLTGTALLNATDEIIYKRVQR